MANSKLHTRTSGSSRGVITDWSGLDSGVLQMKLQASHVICSSDMLLTPTSSLLMLFYIVDIEKLLVSYGGMPVEYSMLFHVHR